MDAIERTKKMLSQSSYAGWTGVKVVELEKDRAVLSLDIAELHKNPYGMVHGGAYYTLADTAAGAAVRSDGRDYVTQNSSMNFLRSQYEGTILAEARVRHRGRSTCVAEVNVTGEDGKLLVTGLMTFFCLGTRYSAE